jgi:hypothetical protein
MEHPRGATMTIQAHIVAAPVKLVPDYIARLEADVAEHKRAIGATAERIERTLREIG